MVVGITTIATGSATARENASVKRAEDQLNGKGSRSASVRGIAEMSARIRLIARDTELQQRITTLAQHVSPEVNGTIESSTTEVLQKNINARVTNKRR